MRTRRTFLKMLGAGTFAAAAPRTLLGTAGRDDKRPNVVLIMADDLGYECLGCNGSISYKTPRLDELAANGIRFEHCYSTPLCTPSRVQIMTGRYNFRNYKAFGYLDPEETTFGHVMKRAGYATMIAGKWQLNGIYHDWPRCQDNTRPFETGFDEYCLWQLTKTKQVGERYWDPLIEQNGKVLNETLKGKYGPDIFCDYICEFIARNKTEPFFVYYPMVLTHSPFVHTPDSREREVRGQPAFADMVAYADKLVGMIVDKLEVEGVLDNTIVLFTGDNGTHRSITSQTIDRTVQGGKGTTPDAGTHVPMVAYWKGHTPKGLVSTDLIDFTDVLPTLADAADAPLPSGITIDGRSFLPQLRGETGNPRDWIFCHYEPGWGNLDQYKARFVRTRRFKLYHDGRFYDVPADVLEQVGVDFTTGGEIELKTSVKKKLQAVLDSMPPWKPLPKPPKKKRSS